MSSQSHVHWHGGAFECAYAYNVPSVAYTHTHYCIRACRCLSSLVSLSTAVKANLQTITLVVKSSIAQALIEGVPIYRCKFVSKQLNAPLVYTTSAKNGNLVECKVPSWDSTKAPAKFDATVQLFEGRSVLHALQLFGGRPQVHVLHVHTCAVHLCGIFLV